MNDIMNDQVGDLLAPTQEADENLICPGCDGIVWLYREDGIGYLKGQIVSHCTDPILGEDSPCPMSCKTPWQALNIKENEARVMPGPEDWGYKYRPLHQRDVHNAAKPAPR